MDRIVEKRSIGGPKQPKATRVAAYARVSSGKDAMFHQESIQYHNREPINCLRCILLFIHKTSKLLFWSSNHSKSLNSQDNSAMHPAL